MKVLLDEMWPVIAAERLRERHGVDAHHVRGIGLGGAPDHAIAEHAGSHGMVVVTENVRDFVDEVDLTVVFVLKRRLAAGGALAASLADVVAGWAARVPNPARRAYWLRP